MTASSRIRELANKLVQLSLDEEGRVVEEKVHEVLESLRANPPREHKQLLLAYMQRIKRELAKGVEGSTLGFEAFRESLHLFDVVVCSTAGEDPILTLDNVGAALDKRPARPLFLIDVAMPRDIEETAGKLENVYLYNLDDVSAIANENLANRKGEVDRCRDALAKRAKRIWDQLAGSANPAS